MKCITKLLAVIMVCAIVCSLAGCRSSQQPNLPAASDVAPSESAQPQQDWREDADISVKNTALFGGEPALSACPGLRGRTAGEYRLRHLRCGGDGSLELLIGSLTGDEYFGKMIFALYTLDQDGAASLLFESGEKNRYYYVGENRFANLGQFSADEYFETTLKLEDSEMIDMAYTTQPADYVQMDLTSFSKWLR